MSHHLIAVDCGAESGRVMVGTLAAGRLTLDTIHRFPNGPVTIDGTLRWDLPALFAEIRTGVIAALKRHPDALSIGIDTWGVDYALLDAAGQLVELPYNHRDRRTNGVVEHVHTTIADGVLFKRTGVRSMQINTLYQLVAHRSQHPEVLNRAAHLLTIPDLLHHWLGGGLTSEWSFAATTQLAVAGKAEWDAELIGRLGLPGRLFRPIVAPGTALGRLKAEIAAEAGITTASPLIIAPASHDTASAVAASPGDPDSSIYLSSGTWSLMGITLAKPLLSDEARLAGFSNELAADGRARLNRNIMGLWLVQECRRGFARVGREYDYAKLAKLAAAAAPSRVELDVDDPHFLQPGVGDDDMPARIRAWLNERKHPVPTDDGALVRLVLDGLAAAYARSARDFQRLAAVPLTTINVIGGGSQHHLLCQLTANATKLEVVAGPVEATVLGNLLVQARGLGLIKTDAEARQVLAASVKLAIYQPR